MTTLLLRLILLLSIAWRVSAGGLLAHAAENPEEMQLSGVMAQEFLLSLFTPLPSEGDWVVLQIGEDTIKAVVAGVTVEELEKTIEVTLNRRGAGGEAIGDETRRIPVLKTTLSFIDPYDTIAVSRKTAELNGAHLPAAVLTGVASGKENAYRFFRDIPLATLLQLSLDRSALPIDHGKGDGSGGGSEATVRLDAIEAFLESCYAGVHGDEYAKYAVRDSAGSGFSMEFSTRKRFRKDDVDALMTLKFPENGEDREPVFISLSLPEVAESILSHLRETTDAIVMSEESVRIGETIAPGVVVTGFDDGWPVCRYYFSPELTLPKVARSFIFLPGDPATGYTDLEWWSHPSPESVAETDTKNRVMGEIAKAADSSFAQAEVGDWALYANSKGGSIRYVVAEVEDKDGERVGVTLRIEERGVSGETTSSRSWSADADSWISGSLPSGDFAHDELSVSHGETEIKGVKRSTVVVTGSRNGKKTYQLVFAEGTGIAATTEFHIFQPMDIPVYTLLDYGSSSD